MVHILWPPAGQGGFASLVVMTVRRLMTRQTTPPGYDRPGRPDQGEARMLGLAVMATVGVLGVVLAVLVARSMSIAQAAVPAMPFQSGWRPEEHALSRFHARFYPLTLLFLAFDVEMLYMYPWAVVVAEVGTSAVVEMFAFLAVLMVGVLWAWREGALRWT
jgi:NADH:ubiquinone oxidoreductase subunit 3 (subunit A)